MKFDGQRFLVIYSGVLTLAFGAAMLSGFSQANKKIVVEELEVQRIKVKEPDGTLRLLVSNAALAPGIYIKGKEYPHPNRRVAGMIFFNDEGTENGGLIFGGERGKDGTKQSFGHLSFDAYEQDQTMALNSQEGKDGRATKLQFTDYPDHSIVEDIEFMASLKDLPKDQQDIKKKAYFDKKGKPTRRMRLARDADGSVVLAMNDLQGRPRITMKVADDGTPSLRMLDEKGAVVGELVPKPGSKTGG
ncbi:hypothetical protein [Pseudomonas sp. CGJS7]|uniref:hypothetical protein n=1 Tax=Pseudomonas sp. CGJS7 TaxID=3109348 RepID=UPI00300B3BE5